MPGRIISSMRADHARHSTIIRMIARLLTLLYLTMSIGGALGHAYEHPDGDGFFPPPPHSPPHLIAQHPPCPYCAWQVNSVSAAIPSVVPHLSVSMVNLLLMETASSASVHSFCHFSPRAPPAS